jgi:enamine deaminase RidA (YjgF/YER057c/UK114 family)
MGIERVPSEFASYSDVVAVGGPGKWVHVAGQVGMDAEGKVEGDLAAQTNATLDHIERHLSKVGGTLADVVKITTFLLDFDDYPSFSKVRAERFGDDLPASSAVAVADLLLGSLVEIEAVAFIPDSPA